MKYDNHELLQKRIHIIPLIVVILLIITSIATILIFAYSNKNRIIENNKEYLIQTTSQVNSQIDSKFKNSLEKIQILSAAFSRKITSVNDVDEELFHLRNLVEDYVFDYMEYVDFEGMNHNVTGGLSNAKERFYYVDGMKGNSGISYVSKSRATKETLISFHSPVYFEKKIIGSLVGVFKNKNVINDDIEVNFHNEKVKAYLFDSSGTIISTTSKLDTTQNINIKDIFDIDLNNVNFSKDSQIIPINGNIIGAGIAKVNLKDWYILLEFPNGIAERMISKSNNLVFILAIVQIIVFSILILLSVKIIDSEKKFIVRKNIETEDILKEVKKSNEELTKKEVILEEIKEVLASSGMGTWHIELFENEEPRMEADERMRNLLGLSHQNLSPEETYMYWFKNIKPEELQSVLDSVDKMKLGQRDENTYIWNHPAYGLRYVRCGGSAIHIKDKGYVLRGYHYDVTEIMIKEKKLIKQSYTDKLTQLFNRTAFENDLEILDQNPIKDNFVYISMDVNGLKTVNDNIGHAAGDELIVGATTCMKKIFGEFGKIYRIGGDEFVAIIYILDSELDQKLVEFKDFTSNWSGNLVDKLTISLGIVKGSELNNNPSLHEISKLADKRMYDNKSKYYVTKGLVRRGQSYVINALSSLYVKILKINIDDDSYQIVHLNDNNKNFVNDLPEKLSVWFSDLLKQERIHQADLEEYTNKLNVDYLRKFFSHGNKYFSIIYKRKFGNNYRNVLLEIIPANDYSNEDQNLFLYLKIIDNDIEY